MFYQIYEKVIFYDVKTPQNPAPIKSNMHNDRFIKTNMFTKWKYLSIVKTHGPPRSQLGQIHFLRMGIQISLDGLHCDLLVALYHFVINIIESAQGTAFIEN